MRFIFFIIKVIATIFENFDPYESVESLMGLMPDEFASDDLFDAFKVRNSDSAPAIPGLQIVIEELYDDLDSTVMDLMFAIQSQLSIAKS
jgi:hypothetical protein